MSGNTSATGGYLPGNLPPPPPSDDDYTAALQGLVCGLASLPGTLVRPRWQPMPPVQPSADTTWAALGITMIEADQYPYLYHVSDGNGYDVMQRHVTITVMITFYGPGAGVASAAVRDGLYVPQNYEALRALGLKLYDVHDLARVPEIINQQYIDRLDLRVDFRAQADRVYPIFNLLGAQAHIQSETASADVTVYEGTWFDDFATFWDGGTTTWDTTP